MENLGEYIFGVVIVLIYIGIWVFAKVYDEYEAERPPSYYK